MIRQIFEKLNPNGNHYDRGQVRLHASQQSLDCLDRLKGSIKHHDPDAPIEMRFVISGQGQDIYQIGSDQILNKKSISEILKGQWPDTAAKRNGDHFEFSIAAPNNEAYKALFNQLHANLAQYESAPNCYVDIIFDKADFGIASKLQQLYLRLPEGSRYTARLETINKHDSEPEVTYSEGRKLGDDEISLKKTTILAKGLVA